MSSDFHTDSEDSESDQEPETTAEMPMSPTKSPCPTSPQPCPGPRPLVPESKVVKATAKPLFKYRSPLDRSRSPSPPLRPIRRQRFGGRRRGPSPSGARLRREREPAQRPHPHPYSRASPSGRSHASSSSRRDGERPERSRGPDSKHRSRFDVTTAAELQRRQEQTQRSLSKLRVPHQARRRPGDPPFRLPFPVSTKKFVAFPLPAPPKPVAERFTDPMTERMITEACSNMGPETKQVSFSRMLTRFRSLHSFFWKSPNKDLWVSARKETIANAGLGVLTLMLEETVTWAKACVSNGVDLQRGGSDILLSTATCLLHHFCFKVKQMLPCIVPEDHQQSLARQLCYLIVSGHKLLDAVSLLEEVVPESEVPIVLSLALAIPALMLPDHEGLRSPDTFLQHLTAYQPGMIRELMRKALEKHGERCHSRFCRAVTRAMVGPMYPTKALFFVPVD